MGEQTITEIVEVQLTDAEMADYARSMAESDRQVADLENELKAINADFKGQIEAHRLKLRGAAMAVRSGVTQREVECRVEMNTPEPCLKRIIRLDTGAILREEPMTAEEQQGKLFEESQDPVEEAVRDFRDSVGTDGVTLSSNGQSVTIPPKKGAKSGN